MADRDQGSQNQPTITRRALLAGGMALGAAGAVSGLLPGTRGLVERGAATSAAGSSLADVEHVVFLMQENRSFDSYFGTPSGVRGFSDPAVLTQVVAHLAADGATNGPVTMGYFNRSDLPFYYALADAFTICDGYHCSVLGLPTPTGSCRFRPRSTRRGPTVARWSRLTATDWPRQHS